MTTAVNFYNLDTLESDRDVIGEGTNIGEFLKSHDGSLLLCDGRLDEKTRGKPIVLRLGEKVYEFSYFKRPHEKNILERSVLNIFDWSRLANEKTVFIRPDEVAEYANKNMEVSPNFSTQEYLLQKMRKNDREIGIFANQNKKLMLVMRFTVYDRKTFVEKESALYSELKNQMLTV